jgi:hypothetical protein
VAQPLEDATHIAAATRARTARMRAETKSPLVRFVKGSNLASHRT